MDMVILETIINLVKDTKMKKRYLTIIPLLLFIYFNTPIHINNYSWKNNGGGRISDFIFFDETNYFELKWPYIYKNKEKIGFVVFCFYDHLWVYSYRNGPDHGVGEYVAK